MIPADTLIPIIAIIAVFGPLFYVIYLTGKLIKYRIDKKYNSINSAQSLELKEFMDRTEHRLRAIEEIVSEDDITLKTPKKEPVRKDEDTIDMSGKDDEETDLWDGPKSKLKNQLKS